MGKNKTKSKEIPFEELFFSRTNDFLKGYLVKQAGKSQRTKATYEESLLCFLRYVCDVCGLDPMKLRFADCTYDFFLCYIEYLRDVKKYRPSVVNGRIAAIRSYLKYASNKDVGILQTYMTAKKLPLMKIPRERRPVLSEAQLTNLLGAPDTTTKVGLRDCVIETVLYDTAIRVGELVSLTMGSLHLDDSKPYLEVHGKGDTQRFVALTKEAAKNLKVYVSAFHDSPAEAPETPLFFTVYKGVKGQMSVRNVQRILKKYADFIRPGDASLPSSVHPHMYRRSKATEMYRAGVPLAMVATTLGHAREETSRIYAYESDDQIREAVEKGTSAGKEQEPLWKGKEDELARRFGLK